MQPLYRSVADELIQEIESGNYTKGDVFPTEAKLCKRYNVSRVTIRQALQILAEREYVKKVKGSGTHVIFSRRKATLSRSSKIIPFSEEMRLMGKVPYTKVIVFEMVYADSKLAKELALEPEEAVFYYERVLFGDDTPYCYENGYMPLKYFSDLSIAALKKSKINYIENEKGFKLDYSHQTVYAISADEKLSKYLNVDLGSPLLEIMHITYDDCGVPIERNCIIFDSKAYHAHFIKTRGYT